MKTQNKIERSLRGNVHLIAIQRGITESEYLKELDSRFSTATAQPENSAKLTANPKLGNMGDWQGRHNKAIQYPRAGFEDAVVTMLNGWRQYALTVQLRYESKIGDDYVLGPGWQKIGEGIEGLLNGELGRLDAGTLDAFINDTLTQNGVEVNA